MRVLRGSIMHAQAMQVEVPKAGTFRVCILGPDEMVEDGKSQARDRG